MPKCDSMGPQFRRGLGMIVLVLAAGVSAGSPLMTYAQEPKIVTGTITYPDASGLRVLRVRFEPGARTTWHSHERGQVVLVEQGNGRTQIGNGPMKELKPGDTVYYPPNVPHWHGASSAEAMTQVTVVLGGNTKQSGLEVDEAHYSGKAKGSPPFSRES